MSTSTAAPLNKTKRDWGKVFSTVGIVLIVIYCLAPFYWMLVSSLRNDKEIFENSWWPRHPSLENYKAVFSEKNDFANGLINSLVVSIIVTIVALAVATFTAYALARLDFRGKGGADAPHHRHLDVPARGHHCAPAEELRRLGLDGHLPGDDRPGSVLLPAAGGVEPDELLPADAPGARAVRHG